MPFSPSFGLTLGLLLACASVLPVAHRHTDAWAPKALLSDEIEYLPRGDLLDLASLGYKRVLADLLWARATILFGERRTEERLAIYPWLYHLTNLATDLDPQFRAAYKYGGTMLRVDGRFVDQSSLIFQKGNRYLPEEWQFPFGIAMNYFMHKGKPLVAAEWMEKAARMGGGPSYLHNLAASLYVDSDRHDVALAFLEEEERNLPDGPAKVAVGVKILETRYFLARRAAEARLRAALEAAARRPADPYVLVEPGAPSLPEDPLGGRWEWASGGELWSLRSTVEAERFRAIRRDTGLGRPQDQDRP